MLQNQNGFSHKFLLIALLMLLLIGCGKSSVQSFGGQSATPTPSVSSSQPPMLDPTQANQPADADLQSIHIHTDGFDCGQSIVLKNEPQGSFDVASINAIENYMNAYINHQDPLPSIPDTLSIYRGTGFCTATFSVANQSSQAIQLKSLQVTYEVNSVPNNLKNYTIDVCTLSNVKIPSDLRVCGGSSSPGPTPCSSYSTDFQQPDNSYPPPLHPGSANSSVDYPIGDAYFGSSSPCPLLSIDSGKTAEFKADVFSDPSVIYRIHPSLTVINSNGQNTILNLPSDFSNLLVFPDASKCYGLKGNNFLAGYHVPGGDVAYCL
jgi:hypothetical protein